MLAELVKDADETQFAIVFSRLQEHGKAAIPLLESELQRTLTPDWQDPPLSDDWRPVEPLLVTQIEAAKGLLTERFAFCQSMPLDQFPAICEALRASGYRPTRVRPYLSLLPLAGGAVSAASAQPGPTQADRPDEGVYAAAIWTRDEKSWQLQPAVTKNELSGPATPATQDGLVLQDVASIPSVEPGTEPRFIAVWCEPSTPHEERRAVIDVSEAELTTAQTELQKQNFVSETTICIRTDANGHRRYTALFSNLGTPTKLRAAYSGLTLGPSPCCSRWLLRVIRMCSN